MRTPGRLSVTALAIAICVAATSVTAWAAPLPQDHDYQVALRDYLASLTEEDLTLEIQPVTIEEEAFSDTDDLARYWMLAMEGPQEFPRRQGLSVLPRHFLLETIEAGEAVNMSASYVEAPHLAWWTQWDYAGNPYYQSDVVKRRALVAAIVDMIMLDHDHDNGRNARSDYVGGSMIRFAYTYYVAGDVLPDAAREAYEAGLVRMFEKLEQMTPRGSGGSDMEFFQLVGMWYAAQRLGGDYPQRALDRAHVVIDTITSDTGYEKHGNAFDVSYQGIALRFLTWAAMLYEDPTINEALHKMLVLKSHLSLPEPDGTLVGPTHFSTGTAMDAPYDQWAWVSRDAAMAMVDDEAMYTVWARLGVPTPEEMEQSVRRLLGAVSPGEPSDEPSGAWAENHWVRTLNYAYEYYHPGFYDRLVELDEADDPITKPPFGRDESFINDLNGGGEFLAVKIGDYGAVVHTGAIALSWASGVSGKSGGSLSAFWTPERGSAILGRTRATQGPINDEWTDDNGRGPYTWAVHTITGRGQDGAYFSASRIRDISSEYQIEGDQRATVLVQGDLGGSATADPEEQISAATYERVFRFEQDGLTIESGIAFENPDEVAELWEMIPVFLGGGDTAGEVTLHVDGDWQPANETEVAMADRVRLSRYDGHVDVVFEQPMPVRLGADPGEGAFAQLGNGVRNVMIDLTGLDDHRITYRIVPGEGGAAAADEDGADAEAEAEGEGE